MKFNEADLKRIEQLLRLAFSSEHDGEVANSLAALRRLLEHCGMKETAFVESIMTGLGYIAKTSTSTQTETATSTQTTFTNLHAAILLRIDLLKPNEQAFIRSIARYTHNLTAKQKVWLMDIARRLKI